MTSAEPDRHMANSTLRVALAHASRVTGIPVRELLDQAGDDRPESEVLDDAAWSTYDQVRAVLETLASLLGGSHALCHIADDVEFDHGTTPQVADSLQRLGSPDALLEMAGSRGNPTASMYDADYRRVSDGVWLVEHHFRDGFEPYPAFCASTAGTLHLLPKLFGYRDVHVVEEACVCRGDDVCRHRLSWAEADETTRERDLLRQRITALEDRIEQFQETVADLVLAGDLVRVLDRIVTAAARTLAAPGFLLAIDALPGISQTSYARGLPSGEADRLAAGLLSGTTVPELPVSVDVVSARRWYGRLAAYSPTGAVMGDRSLLEAYARLAATALDSAMALEEARREADRSTALLELASSLTEIQSIEAMAQRIVQAAPAVVGADRAAIVLSEPGRNKGRVIAGYGYPSAVLARTIGLEVPLVGDVTDIIYLNDVAVRARLSAPDLDGARALLQGAAANVVVPLIQNGTVEGWLGVGVLDDAERLAPSDELEARLRGLAAQASTAVRNARLVEEIRHQAVHDALTGLPNRALILDRAEQLLARARRDRTPVAALFFDLDGFKTVNDTLGHAVGDQLLQAVAQRMSGTVRDSDTLGRLGGDEFVLLVDGAGFDVGPEVVAERILEVLRQPFLLDGVGEALLISASIGIAVAGEATTAGELLRDADVALYEAKGAGKDQAMLFAPEMQEAVQDRVTLESDLRLAVERGEFFLVYQPILDLRSHEVTGVEALIRWEHPTRGVMAPNDFIPMLEQTGLIVPAGRWVLGEACAQLAAWHRAGHHIDMSVNVSARQLDTDGFVDDVTTALATSGLSPSSLILEITETTIMQDTQATIRRLRNLKALGVRIAIDDFGTGYSSLAYLRQFPVDALKIDRSFINAIADSAEAGALIHTLVHLGKALGLSTLAEGIEDREQFAQLQMEDCDSGQGFLFARPVPAAELEAYLVGAATPLPSLTAATT
jgi:diguanylate cyclase (GGDEF)-like protein